MKCEPDSVTTVRKLNANALNKCPQLVSIILCCFAPKYPFKAQHTTALNSITILLYGSDESTPAGPYRLKNTEDRDLRRKRGRRSEVSIHTTATRLFLDLRNLDLKYTTGCTETQTFPGTFFRRQLRLDKRTFELLLDELRPQVTRQDTRMRKCISPESIFVIQ